MPITKVPVVHKFGIISSSQRVELQERLRRQALCPEVVTKKPISCHRDLSDVTEEFVQLFNDAENFHEKEKYEEKAKKLLERAKRRSGVKNCGEGDHVNLPLAWTEMIQLAQCKGRIQEECLDVLVTSLDVSPLEKRQIVVLFYLAESVLYRLQIEELHQPFLRTVEIKLLKVGQLVFERLFYHHMTGQLQQHRELKKHLCTYIHGLDKFEQMYHLYPNAVFYLSFIIQSGQIVLSESQTENLATHMDKLPSASQQDSQDVKNISDTCSQIRTTTSQSRAISSSHNLNPSVSNSVHDLSPSLWHALDVFRCTNSLSGGLSQALQALEICAANLANETCVDGIVSVQILGQSARTNLATMKVLYRLAQGNFATESSATTLPLGSSQGGHLGDKRGFDKCEKSETCSNLQKGKYNTKASSRDTSSGHVYGEEEKERMTNVGESIQQTNSRLDLAEEFQYLHMPGFFGWQLEVTQTYIEVLESIVLSGNTAAIQKYALVGHSDDYLRFHGQNEAAFSNPSLVHLAFFNPKIELLEGELNPNNRSWRIRFGAVQSLTRISRVLKGDGIHEGLRTIAWSILLKANAEEKDQRVTEALRVSQLHTDSQSQTDSSTWKHPVCLGQRLAIGLSAAYLPPLAAASWLTPRVMVPHQTHPVVEVSAGVSPTGVQHERGSLRNKRNATRTWSEVNSDSITRTSLSLRRIIDDQWKKELQDSKQDEADTEQGPEGHERLLEVRQQKVNTRQMMITKKPSKELFMGRQKHFVNSHW